MYIHINAYIGRQVAKTPYWLRYHPERGPSSFEKTTNVGRDVSEGEQ